MGLLPCWGGADPVFPFAALWGMRAALKERHPVADGTIEVNPREPSLPLSDFEGLFAAAREAAGKAYAPYSHFRVGTALRTESGGVHSGCNMENVSYPVGICAERAALAQAVVAEGPAMRVAALEVVAIDPQGNLVACTPCGACRQAIMELGPRARTRFRTRDGHVVERSSPELLPDAFEF